MADSEFYPVVVGRLGAPYGVKGWLHLQSFTDPADNILRYKPLHIKQQKVWQTLDVSQSKQHGAGFVIKLGNCDDREQAALLTNELLAIDHDQLPELEENEYYWSELEGMRVINQDNVDFGTVKQVLATGANDVLVVKGDRERLIPFTQGHAVKQVDLEKDIISVDWDVDF